MAGSTDPNVNIHFGEKEETKTLGLYWSSNQDVLMYNITSSIYPTITKRTVLSDIARIFDPLGLLGPTIIKAKILLQKLWAERLSWDESLPADIDYRWRHFRNELHLLNDLKIPRHVVYDKAARIELHGFSDASIEAFGACVYIRSISMDGHCQISLVLAKSKVAPIKSVTIPRLELCGSLVLAQIVNKVKLSMSITFDEVYLWCDSSVALSWISTSPHLLQTFVGNRVSQIQSLTKPNQWRHIRSGDNPADIISRGIDPKDLLDCKLWWNGPSFLYNDESLWPDPLFLKVNDVPELRKTQMSFQINVAVPIVDFARFSKLSRLQRTVAYIKRFISNCKSQKDRQIGSLTSIELDNAKKALLKIAQQEYSYMQDLSYCYPH
ncbi:hypothetical protein NQ317_017877 [Molorchus minor]|uniref:Uncharacterized protein n=1 Tax=Molorchus minor TaxID=1323400 RepID=A0ABQ9JAF8_9CUCU|nr:hypothetical protein NQ317_017877 [Molorchus minor]